MVIAEVLSVDLFKINRAIYTLVGLYDVCLCVCDATCHVPFSQGHTRACERPHNSRELSKDNRDLDMFHEYMIDRKLILCVLFCLPEPFYTFDPSTRAKSRSKIKEDTESVSVFIN